ncbi:MAG: glycosyltransferase, partial [Cyanobacteria bacterium J083]
PLGGTALIKLAFKQLLRWIYNSYDATLIHSQVTHQKLIELGIKNTIYENLNGFDDSKFNPSLKQSGFFAQTYNNPSLDEQIKLIFLGRLTPDKGWGFTMKAFAEVSKKVDLSKVAILIAGDGEMREIIQQTLEKYVPNLYMLGRVAPEKIPALLANCDVHVTTSEKENRALTVIEALAVGVPVVAPRAGGVVQDVQPGVTGLLFEPQNIEDFAAKIKEIVYNQELRLTMGLKGREYISKYTWDNTITNLVKIWQQQIQLKSR